ncbi:MAG: hypothetical protein JXB10_02845 [Pirellulales bacterium]|nr:hypothetical protein [Pirellulales bacterium]
MKRLWKIVWTGCQRIVLVWGCWAMSASAVWARGEAEKSARSNTQGWILPYILVVLGIALGMLVVCKSSGRRDRAKPEGYGEGKSGSAEEEKKKEQ